MKQDAYKYARVREYSFFFSKQNTKIIKNVLNRKTIIDKENR